MKIITVDLGLCSVLTLKNNKQELLPDMQTILIYSALKKLCEEKSKTELTYGEVDNGLSMFTHKQLRRALKKLDEVGLIEKQVLKNDKITGKLMPGMIIVGGSKNGE